MGPARICWRSRELEREWSWKSRERLSPGQTVLPTRAKFTTSMELGIVWVGSSSIELAWIWSNSNFRSTQAKFSTVCPPQPTQANSRQVVLLLLCDYAVVFRQLNGFLQAGLTWQYRLATRWCKFWFCDLARVGLSWEHRLARVSVMITIVIIRTEGEL